MKYRDLGSDVKEKFIELFHRGHSPASALKCHKTDLLLQEGENYYKVAADGMLMPSYSIVCKLFEKEFSKRYGTISGDEMFGNLRDVLENYVLNTGGKATFSHTKDDKYYYVVICTAMMLRTHEKIIQASEVVMVDASGGVDKQRHRIYFLATPCVAGSLPLGIIITNSEKGEVFQEALQCFNNLLPAFAFYNKKFPEIFLTDNDLKEISAIEKVFPASKTLLCQFHMLKAFWSWLCDTKHSIQKDHRQEMYFHFKRLLYSEDIEKAKENLKLLVDRALFYSYHNLVCHITEMMKIKEKWMKHYRVNLPLRGSNTTNYVEVLFKVLKDSVLERTMAFNLTQLVDFLITQFNEYMHQRLTDFFNGRHGSSLYRYKVMLKNFDEKVENFKVNEITTGMYEVHIEKENPTLYMVDVARGICSCDTGSSGKLCAHAVAVLSSLDQSVHTGFKFVSQKLKEDIFYVTEGKFPEEGWFLPLSDNASNKDTGCNKFTEELENAGCEDNVHISTVSENEDAVIKETELESTSEVTENDHSETIFQLKEFFDRIQKGIQSNSNVFLPAVKKMLKNASMFAATETGLVTALHTFATYSGVQRTLKKKDTKNERRSHKTYIGVQPTAIARRKYSLAGKKNVCAGRPRNSVKSTSVLQCHDYTTFGHLPSRKRKAPHDLEKCVQDNKSLGKTSKSK